MQHPSEAQRPSSGGEDDEGGEAAVAGAAAGFTPPRDEGAADFDEADDSEEDFSGSSACISKATAVRGGPEEGRLAGPIRIVAVRRGGGMVRCRR